MNRHLSRRFLFPLSLLACCAGLPAQQSSSRRISPEAANSAAQGIPFELDKQNTDRVAASPEQIREVLAKDPGLLVELKRWAAKEATSNAQLIDDADLTDQAIFDRLDDDVKFRSAATRLLQRYGYLLPAVNPDSALGKQQELLLKERARRLVQIEAQEDAQSSKQGADEEGSQSLQQATSCNPRSDSKCTNQRGGKSSQNGSQVDERPRAIPEPQGNPGAPAPPAPLDNSPVLRTGLDRSNAATQVPALGNASDSVRLAAMSASLDPSGLRASTISPEALAGALRGGANAEAGDPSSAATPWSPHATRNTSSFVKESSRETLSVDPDKNSSEGTIIHKFNPYADLPSLYDLYVQAANHDKKSERFGVEILSSGIRDPDAVPMDLPVGPDYVVGPGDSLSIDLWGGVSQRMLRVVDREGRISLPESGPLLVNGRTLGEVQLIVQQSLRTQFRDASADVSLSRIRTIRVYVVGEVNNPGAYDIGSLSTPLNALVAAGGVTQRGSLRLLKHYRGKQLIEVVDAYDLLLRGIGSGQKRFESGDSLLIPPVGPQVTVEGMVRRPAIYELQGEKTLEDVLELGGGILPAAALQHVEVERLNAHQNWTMFSVDLSAKDGVQGAASKLTSFQVQDGDRIHIFPIAPYNDGAIYLQGHVLRPGRYSYRDGMKLTDLVSSYGDLLPEPAGKYAEIIRLNPPDFRPSVESFDLSAALENPTAAPTLKPLDTIRIFSKYDFEQIPAVWVGGEVRAPGEYIISGQVHLRDAIYLAGGVSPDAGLDSAQLFRTTRAGTMTILSVHLSEALSGNPIDNLILQPHDRIIVHRNEAKLDPPTVYVKGEVAKPGRYPLASNMHVQDLVRVAGGLKPSADTQNAILSRQGDAEASDSPSEKVTIHLPAAMTGQPAENKLLDNGDVLTIRQNPGWKDLGATVTIRGEVEHPGAYGIHSGEPLSSVLADAGGFTPQAYPYGILLTRRDVRAAEMQSHEELVARVKAEAALLKALPETDQDQKNAKLTAIAQTETTLTQLEANLPVGRVVIHMSPDMKSFDHSAADTPLRNGDVIVIPRKADYVLVNGQVFHATAVGYVAGRSAKWYLGQAGGVTQLADKNAMFVIRANGSVLPAKNNSALWSGDPMDAVLLPGDSIVVPEKAPRVGGRNWAPVIQSAQIATSVALAVAYIKP
jgi:protein involved in polysaccharide export with SLBB domain